MKAKDKFNHDSSLYTWLCAIARNLWADHCKKIKKEISTDALETDALERMLGASESSIEQELSDKDSAYEIHLILHSIPEPYKEVFSLRVFGQLPLKDIASIFGKTESWARVTYYRARKMITEKIRKDDSNDRTKQTEM
jgi:RNA polymerase sigma-70 factor (ECF subfamily)